MSHYDRPHRNYRPYNPSRARGKLNIYDKRISAQRRNKMYKHQKNYYSHNCNDNNNYSGDENESVDSLKKIEKLRSEISSIFIPTQNKDTIYGLNGHIMHLTAITQTKNFHLTQFIKTITNRDRPNVIQRAKLLKVEIINNKNDNNGNLLTLKITVSSPLIFNKLLLNSQHILTINNISYKYKISPMYSISIQSKLQSLKLCIKQFSASQDCAIWSSYDTISYHIENKAEIPGIEVNNKLFLYIGSDAGTEYKITVNPLDIYYCQYRNDGNDDNFNKQYYLKLRLFRPCTIHKLPIKSYDHSYDLKHSFPAAPNGKKWTNPKGKIFRQCGNEQIYNDSQLYHNEAIYHRHAEYFDDFGSSHNDENSLEMLPKIMGKALILFFTFDAKYAEPVALLKWLREEQIHRYNYQYFVLSPSLIPPPNIMIKNEYRDNLLNLRGGECIDEILIDSVDYLINEARIADEYVMHEQELTSAFLDILTAPKYKNRFVKDAHENRDQLLIRYALQYYACYTVKNLKNKIGNMYQSHSILSHLMRDIEGRIFNKKRELLVTQPFINRNSIEIKRVLVTPTRVVMCAVEYWPLSNIFKWIVNEKYMDNLLFISFVNEEFESMPSANIQNGSYFGFILKKYILNGIYDGRIIIYNRTYQYLFSTPSLFRHRTLCFFQPSSYVGGKRVRCMQLLNRICRPQLTTNGILTHYATQRFLPSICSVSGTRNNIKFVQEEEVYGSGWELYTDGTGLMPLIWANSKLYDILRRENVNKLSLYRLNIDEYYNNKCPTLVRFAYRGYFGVLTLNPYMDEKGFIFRKSQKKYRFQQSDDMEIYEFSYWKPAYLSPHSIFILQSLGICPQVIYKLVCERIKLLNHARCNDMVARHLLFNLDYISIPAINCNAGNGYSFKNSVWMKAFNCGLLAESEVFLSKFIQIVIENEIKILRNEYKIYLEYKHGALLYGCFDELKILKANEVFIQTFNVQYDRFEIWDDSIYKKVVIFNENHCYYPSDVIIMDLFKTSSSNNVECVNKLASIYMNVIVFAHPSKYKQCDVKIPIFFQCGGATLNGETQFMCIRKPDMIPNIKNINTNYIKYPAIIMNDRGRVIPQINTHKKAKISDAKAYEPAEEKEEEETHGLLHDDAVNEQNVMEYAYATLANNSIDIDILKYLWLSHADSAGADCTKCKELSMEIYKAKKYHLLGMKLNGINKYKCNSFPFWIQINKSKQLNNAEILNKKKYESQSIMKHIKRIIDEKYKKAKLSSRTLGYDVVLNEENDIIRRYRANGDEICDFDLMSELENNLKNGGGDWGKYFGEFEREIFDLLAAFEFDLFLKCKQYGIINECELLTYKLLDLKTKQISLMDWNEYNLLLLKRKQFLCGRNEEYSQNIVLSKIMHDMLLHYRQKLMCDLHIESDKLYAKSVYIYYLIYKKNFETVKSKENYPFPSLLFAWILADYWLAIKITVKQQKKAQRKPLQPVPANSININLFMHDDNLYVTPGFIGNSVFDKKQILMDHEKSNKMNDEYDENYHAECNDFPKPDFIHIINQKEANHNNKNNINQNEMEEEEEEDDDDDDYHNHNGTEPEINNYADVEKYYKPNPNQNNNNNENEFLKSLRVNNNYHNNIKYSNISPHIQ